MKKSSLFLVGAIALAMAVSSCKDDFQEPDPTPPTPTEKKMVLNLNIDFPSFGGVVGFYAGTITSREGLNYNIGDQFIDINPDDQEWKENLSVTLPNYLDSLRGKTCEIIFMVEYMYEGALWTAELIREVTFSTLDTTDLGNVGFSNYEWFTHPPLRLVIVPDDIKQYASY